MKLFSVVILVCLVGLNVYADVSLVEINHEHKKHEGLNSKTVELKNKMFKYNDILLKDLDDDGRKLILSGAEEFKRNSFKAFHLQTSIMSVFQGENSCLGMREKAGPLFEQPVSLRESKFEESCLMTTGQFLECMEIMGKMGSQPDMGCIGITREKIEPYVLIFMETAKEYENKDCQNQIARCLN